MPLYLISYDLLKVGQNYDSLIQALEQQGAKRVLYSQWALRSSSTSAQVRDWVQQYTDANDRILVSEINNNWASYAALVDLNQV